MVACETGTTSPGEAQSVGPSRLSTMATGETQQSAFTPLLEDIYDVRAHFASSCAARHPCPPRRSRVLDAALGTDTPVQDPDELSQLLEQRTGGQAPFHLAGLSPEKATLSVSATTPAPRLLLPHAPPLQLPAPSPTRNFAHRRAACASKHDKPSLPKQHSAPTPTGVPLDSQLFDRMFHSCGDNQVGDTQPDSQIYKAWLERGDTRRSESPSRAISVLEYARRDEAAYHRQINLVASSVNNDDLSPVSTSPTTGHAIADQDDTQPESNVAPTSPLKFHVATPAAATRIRNVEEDGLSSIARTATTPGSALAAAAFFPPANGSTISNPLSLTQIFNGTQAGTSPVVGRLDEDAALQRPSPNFARRSSPGLAYSSPTKLPRNNMQQRSSSEPRGPYVTMGQSQERRSREVEDTDEVEPSEQDSWEEPAEFERQRAKRQARERVELNAAQTFQKVIAPALSSPVRPPGRKLSSLASVRKVNTPRSRRRTRISAYDGPFDDDELEGMSRSAGEDAEGGVQGEEATHPIRKKVNDGEEPVQVPRTSSHPQGSLSGQLNRRSPLGSPSASAQLRQETQARDPISQQGSHLSQIQNQRASFTIVDSQPESAGTASVPRPRNLLPSSPSTNHYSINNTTMGKTVFTSQVVSSSVPPMPPQSSSPELGVTKVEEGVEDDTRVPSSPPAVVAEGDEDDVEYDEHDYSDHEVAKSPTGGAEASDSDDELLDPGHASEEEMEVERTAPIVEDEENEDSDMNNSPAGQDHLDNGETEMIRSSHSDGGDSKSASNKSPVHQQNTAADLDMRESAHPAFTENNSEEPTQSVSPTIERRTTEPMAAPKRLPSAGNAEAAPQLNNRDNSSTVGHNIGELGASETRPFQSLSHIANLPDTQLTETGSVDIPDLPFLGEDLDDLAKKSPVRPSPRKPLITYHSKRTRTGPRSLLFAADGSMKPAQSSPPPQEEPHEEESGSPAPEHDQSGTRVAANVRPRAASASHQSRKRKLSAKDRAAKPQKRARLNSVKKSTDQNLVNERSALDSPATSEAPAKHNTYDLSDDHEGGADLASVASSSSLDELAATPPTPEPLHSRNDKTRHASTHSTAGTADDELCNRVFALWPGQGYYPATCLGPVSTNRVLVRYDDGNSTEVDPGQLRSLDLQKGDLVKVDIPGMKKHTYIVIGTVDELATEDEERLTSTDVHGHRRVVLEVKQRESLSVDERKPTDTVTVPIENIYLTQQLFTKFRNRLYRFAPSATRGFFTPQITVTTEISGYLDSPSVSRRSGAAPSLLRQSIAANTMSPSPPESSIFSSMAFAVTINIDPEGTDKQAFSELVLRNGGQLLDSFDELFEDLETTEPVTQVKPTQKSKVKTAKHAATSLVLKDENAGLRSAVLITDAHSRRTKYIQALALNIPCVHYRWLSDSIIAGVPLPYGKYLLPAGVSTYLDPQGVIRSRNMELYDPNAEDASFEEMVNCRDLLLRNQAVLLIAGKSKREMERKKPYVFLSYALGPRVIGRCSDLASAKELLQAGSWDWVNVDGDVDDLAEAERVIFGSQNGAGASKPVPKNRRHKRRSESLSSEAELLCRVGEIGDKKVRLVCDEFVIQSLILGDLVES